MFPLSFVSTKNTAAHCTVLFLISTCFLCCFSRFLLLHPSNQTPLLFLPPFLRLHFSLYQEFQGQLSIKLLVRFSTQSLKCRMLLFSQFVQQDNNSTHSFMRDSRFRNWNGENRWRWRQGGDRYFRSLRVGERGRQQVWRKRLLETLSQSQSQSKPQSQPAI